MVPIYECGMYINSESIDLDKLREVDEALVTALGDGLTVLLQAGVQRHSEGHIGYVTNEVKSGDGRNLFTSGKARGDSQTVISVASTK